MTDLICTDPMERLIEAALIDAGYSFLTGHGNQNPARLDFYVKDLGIHIEVKRLHSDRIARQMARAENVIAVQGDGAVKALAKMIRSHPND